MKPLRSLPAALRLNIACGSLISFRQHTIRNPHPSMCSIRYIHQHWQRQLSKNDLFCKQCRRKFSTDSSAEAKKLEAIQDYLLGRSTRDDALQEEGRVTNLHGCIVNCKGLKNASIGSPITFNNYQLGIVLQISNQNCLVGLLSNVAAHKMGAVRNQVEIGEVCWVKKMNQKEDATDLSLCTTSPFYVTSPAEFFSGNSGLLCGAGNTAESIFSMHAPPTVSNQSRFSEHLPTGVLCLDTLSPIGKGQRILINGPPKSGKTGFLIPLISSVLSKNNSLDSVVYVTLSPPSALNTWLSSLEAILSTASSNSFNADRQSSTKSNNQLFVVNAFGVESELNLGLTQPIESAMSQYLAPIVGLKLAIKLRFEGRSPLLIFDDVEKHTIAATSLLEMMSSCIHQSLSYEPRSVAALPLSAPSVISSLLAHASCCNDATPPLTVITVLGSEEGAEADSLTLHYWRQNVEHLLKDAADSCIAFQKSHIVPFAGPFSIATVDLDKLHPWVFAPFQHPLLKVTAKCIVQKMHQYNQERASLQLRNDLKIFVDFWEKEELQSLKASALLLSTFSCARGFSMPEILILCRAIILFFFTSEIASYQEVRNFQEGLLNAFKRDYDSLWCQIFAEFESFCNGNKSKLEQEDPSGPLVLVPNVHDHYAKLLSEIDYAIATYRFSFPLTIPHTL